MKSPLITFQKNTDDAHFFQVFSVLSKVEPISITGADGTVTTHANHDFRLKTQVVKKRDGIHFDTIEEAEDYVLTKIKLIEINSNNDPFHHPDCMDRFTIPTRMRQHASTIAVSTRRGWPTGTLMHPKMADFLKRDKSNGWIETDNGPAQIGRWKNIGLMEKCGTVYASEHMPENEIVLFYNNQFYYDYNIYNLKEHPPKWTEGNKVDGPAVFLKKTKHLFLNEVETSPVINWAPTINDYIKRLEFFGH